MSEFLLSTARRLCSHLKPDPRLQPPRHNTHPATRGYWVAQHICDDSKCGQGVHASRSFKVVFTAQCGGGVGSVIDTPSPQVFTNPNETARWHICFQREDCYVELLLLSRRRVWWRLYGDTAHPGPPNSPPPTTSFPQDTNTSAANTQESARRPEYAPPERLSCGHRGIRTRSSACSPRRFDELVRQLPRGDGQQRGGSDFPRDAMPCL
jgi:hypothetical protein